MSKIKIQRLKDKAKRWTHHSDDPKRVFCLEVDGKKIVITSYIAVNRETEKRFQNNILMHKELNKCKISCPLLLASDEFDLVFVTEHKGEEMPTYLEKVSLKEAKDKVSQAVEIIWKISGINSKLHPFVMPNRLVRFQKFYEEGRYKDLPIETKSLLGRFYDDVREIDQQNRHLKFDYGYGLSAADFIDFLVDEKGTVSIIDFDELIEFYDPYYGIGYFWVSLERAKQSQELQKHLLKNLDLSHFKAEERFKWGAIAAMSNQLRISYTNPEVIKKRLKEIYDLWEKLL